MAMTAAIEVVHTEKVQATESSRALQAGAPLGVPPPPDLQTLALVMMLGEDEASKEGNPTLLPAPRLVLPRAWRGTEETEAW